MNVCGAAPAGGSVASTATTNAPARVVARCGGSCGPPGGVHTAATSAPVSVHGAPPFSGTCADACFMPRRRT
jgi:hypothetical protein